MAQQVIGTLVGVVLGALLTWIGNSLATRGRAALEMREKLRVSYSTWFTAHSLAMIRVQLVLGRPLASFEQLLDMQDEARDLFTTLEGVVRSSHEVLLVEELQAFRELIQGQTEIVV